MTSLGRPQLDVLGDGFSQTAIHIIFQGGAEGDIHVLAPVSLLCR